MRGTNGRSRAELRAFQPPYLGLNSESGDSVETMWSDVRLALPISKN